jgi:holo-[acyl-carrier protein] synthase
VSLVVNIKVDHKTTIRCLVPFYVEKAAVETEKDMITGIGVDLIEVNRVSEACRKESFLKRCFTELEIELIAEDDRKAADNFAVKEAVAKMLGTGFRTFFPIDIEVLRTPEGKPYVNLHGKASELAKEQGVSVIHVSITNTREYANAFVVGETRP